MKPSNKEEVVAYLTETLAALRQIKSIASNKNKTLRIKAVTSMLTILEARIDAGCKYAKAGGEIMPLTMQQDLYNPIIEWLAGELQ